jgi:DNA mismatch repair ATPase MutS
VGPLSVEIPLVCDLLSLIEAEPFSSPKLVALAARLKVESPSASAAMRRLRRLIKLLQERENQWFALLAYLLLWGTQFCAAIDRWHRRQGTKMMEWLAILGEFEALVSLSTYANEHPADVVPELVEEGPLYVAKDLGHPLIDEAICVRNDVRLGGDLRFLIVSGSNMSGKSTFLRAIGISAVLARMGAPVRCAQMRLSLLTVGAAIRISDSLAEGRSHFFAEMDRLRRLIELAGEGPLLYLADEIMIGTNSHDRRIAAEWVVRALVRRDAIGLVTTHDLALTEIALNGLPGANVYFEDSGEGGELRFDYKLRRGVLSRSNALNIAHILGIDAAASAAISKGNPGNTKEAES